MAGVWVAGVNEMPKCEREGCGGTMIGEPMRLDSGRWIQVARCLMCGREAGEPRPHEVPAVSRRRVGGVTVQQ